MKLASNSRPSNNEHLRPSEYDGLDSEVVALQRIDNSLHRSGEEAHFAARALRDPLCSPIRKYQSVPSVH